MKANQIVFQELLNGNIQYRVPLFQRTYSWKEENWEQLWTDILEIYAMNEPRNHFIGSIVTQPIPDAPERASKHMLIDGQQRMTTLLIILSVIRNKAQMDPQTWGQLADQIQQTCLINPFAIPEERNKLLPTQEDREPFMSVMNGESKHHSSQILSAWQYFDKAISEGDIDEQDINLNKLMNCITNYLDMVSINLEIHDSPNRIFESLNNTGMPLSVSDLIRNHLFMNISDWDGQKAAYDKHWYPMQQMLNKGDMLSDFFWRYLMMRGSLGRKDETYNGVQQLLNENKVTSQIVVKFLAEFYQFSQYYAQLVQVQPSKFGDSVSKRISRLNQWEVSVAYPFLMRALNYVNLGHISKSDLTDAMDMIESYIIRRAICGVPTNRLRRIFVQMSIQVSPDNFLSFTKQALLNNRWPEDGEFYDKFTEYRLYNRSRLSRTRLILDTLQISFGDKESPDLSKPEITIEHIMPQTLSDKWKQDLGSNYTEVYDRRIDTVGNLTLTGYNSELGNMPFSDDTKDVDKKRKLAEAKFALSSSIQDFSIWNEDSIKQRGEELAERALQLWPR